MENDEEVMSGKMQEALQMLSEYFSTVYILTSNYDPVNDETVIYHMRFGCPFSVHGQIKAVASTVDDEGVPGLLSA